MTKKKDKKIKTYAKKGLAISETKWYYTNYQKTLCAKGKKKQLKK